MTQASPQCHKPLLVVGHGLRSAPALQIVEAASDLCEILWLIDESVPENALSSRLLKKVGTVVNHAGATLEEVVSIVRAHRPAGVVTFRDEDIVLLSQLAGELGLDYHSPEVARVLVDKFSQREALRKGGLPTPLCWEVPNTRDRAAIEALATAVVFPAVVKPRTGSGGQYTVAVADAADLVHQLALLPPHAGGASGLMIEQYIPGLASSGDRFAGYVSVESLVAAGRVSHLALTGRFPLAEPFRETGFFIPADLSGAEQDSVLQVATAALGALGVRTGGFHTEVKLTPDGPRVLEVNGRLGGGVPEMLFQASGVSLMRLSMRVALGEVVEVEGPVPCGKVGWRFLFQAPSFARRVVSIEGLDRVSALPEVNSVLVNRAPGDQLDVLDGTRQYVYSVFGASQDYEGLLEMNRFLHEEVAIAYE
ncbi:MAG: hypothetical protein ABSD97_02740 [Acidimicrobiales bacterium]